MAAARRPTAGRLAGGFGRTTRAQARQNRINQALTPTDVRQINRIGANTRAALGIRRQAARNAGIGSAG